MNDKGIGYCRQELSYAEPANIVHFTAALRASPKERALKHIHTLHEHTLIRRWWKYSRRFPEILGLPQVVEIKIPLAMDTA